MALSAVPQFTRASICYSAPNTSSPKNIVFYSFGLQNCFSGWDDWDICPLVLLVFIFLLSIFCLFWCLVLVLCLCLFFVLMLFGVWFLCFAFRCVSLLVFFFCANAFWYSVFVLRFLVLYSFSVFLCWYFLVFGYCASLLDAFLFWCFFVLMLFGVWCLCFSTPLLNQVGCANAFWCLVPVLCFWVRFSLGVFLCKCFLVFGVCALLFLVLYSFGVFFVLMLFGVWCLCFATPLLNQVAAQGPAACRLCRFQTNRFLLYSVHCNAQCTLYNSIHNARWTMQSNI